MDHKLDRIRVMARLEAVDQIARDLVRCKAIEQRCLRVNGRDYVPRRDPLAIRKLDALDSPMSQNRLRGSRCANLTAPHFEPPAHGVGKSTGAALRVLTVLC